MNKTVNKILTHIRCSEYIPFCIGLLCVIIYEILFVVNGEDSWIRIHDCLDDTVAHVKMYVNQGGLLDKDKVLPIMYGIKSRDFTVGLSFQTILYYLFPTYWAYLLNDTVVRLFAYLGMYLLLSRHVLDYNEKVDIWIGAMTAACFAYISFYTIYGLSSAGVPLALYAFNNLLKNRKVVLSYLMIFLFAVGSSFVLSGLFVCLFVCFMLYQLLEIKCYIHNIL